MMRTPPLLPLLALLLFARGLAAEPRVTVAIGENHRGWHDAIVLRNGTVEAVIVPSVGRVMQFRFAGETDGPFWENEKLAGQPMPADPWKAAHGSFGGDKTWPAPQTLWNWPPPDVFDAAPLTARVNDDRSVTLTSPVSSRFGLRTMRRIALDATEPVMRIETTYEKISGEPVTVSVWIITQLRDPVAGFLRVPANSKFPRGVSALWPMPEKYLHRDGDWLRLTRDPAESHKTGNDGTVLVWAGRQHLLRIDLSRAAEANYPDDGCSAEIYTNADPVPYVEFETLGPLKTLRTGETASATNTYRLARRGAGSLETDFAALFAH
jgi:hypothetical protein